MENRRRECMEHVIRHAGAVPVGDQSSGYIPRVIAISLHRKQMMFNLSSKNIIAVLTDLDLRIFSFAHQSKKESWVQMFKVGWKDRSWKGQKLSRIKCLDWHSKKFSLFIGDDAGNIVHLFPRRKDRCDSTFLFKRIIHLDEPICSISSSGNGRYLAVACRTHMSIMQYIEGNLSLVEKFWKTSGKSIVKFHPFHSFLFMASQHHGVLKVFSNLAADLSENSTWKQLAVVTGGSGCTDLSLWVPTKNGPTLIVTTGTESSFWTFEQYKAEGVGQIPFRFVHNGILSEYPNLKGQAKSISILRKNLLVIGCKEGALVLYKWGKPKADRTQALTRGPLKETYIEGRIFYPHHSVNNPTANCIIKSCHQTGKFHLIVGTNGFLYLNEGFQTDNEDIDVYANQDPEWEETYYERPEAAEVEDDGYASSESESASNEPQVGQNRVELFLNTKLQSTLVTEENRMRKLELSCTIEDPNLIENLFKTSF